MQLPIESLNLLMLNVGYANHNGDWNWQNVSSPFARIYYVTEGNAQIIIEQANSSQKTIITLKPNHLYMIPAYTVHSYQCDSVFSHYYLHVYEGFKKETDIFEYYNFPYEVNAESGELDLFTSLLNEYPDFSLPASDPKSYDNTTVFTDYVRRYNDLDLFQKMKIRGLILIVFSHFLKFASKKVWISDDRLLKVLDYIHSHIYDEINLDTLSDKACVTKPYLIRIFKKNFSISPLQYINNKKIEKAQLILITEDLPVKEVAYKLGFNDHSYFIRLFKKLTGRTPLEYRDTMR